MKYGRIEPATTDKEKRRRQESNRAAWNEGAAWYTATNEERVELLEQGKSTFHPIERANLAQFGALDTWCNRAIHLQCASGQDTLSLIVEGAREVVGVDISDKMIENAQWTSDQLGWKAKWYRCDVYDTPKELNGTADLVYTGRGALCWLMDINKWAETVARLLKPNGVFTLFDGHPVTWLFQPDADSLIGDPETSYFGYWETNVGWSDAYIGDVGSDPAPKFERLWTISEVVNALINAGLTLVSLGEHPGTYWDEFPNLSETDKARIPMTFSVVAKK